MHKSRRWQLVLGVLCFILLSPLTVQADVETILSKPPSSSSLYNVWDSKTAQELFGNSCNTSGGSLADILDAGNEIAVGKVNTYTNFCGFITSAQLAISEGRDPELDKIEALLNEGRNEGVFSATLAITNQVVDQRPASAAIYAQEIFNKVVNPGAVYAQDIQPYYPGSGYELMRPIQGFWGWAVTISYSFMIFIIIIVSFAMLFRNRLGGKEVVTIQNAIPGIVLAMVLIPLSYPVSGLFIDGITLGTNIVHDLVFSSTGPGQTVYTYDKDIPGILDGVDELYDFDRPEGRGLYADDIRFNPLVVWTIISTGGIAEVIGETTYAAVSAAVDKAIPDSANDEVKGAAELGATSQLPLMITGSLFGFVSDNSAGIGGAIVDILATILQLAFAFIGIVVGVWITWKLLKKYLILLIMPIVSPFIFASAAIPGRGTSTIMWYLKSMASASLAFIMTYTMFVLAIILAHPGFIESLTGAGVGGGIGTLYEPPLLAGWVRSIANIGASGAGNANFAQFLFSIIGFSIFITIPNNLNRLDDFMGTKFAVPQFLKDAAADIGKTADIAYRQVPGKVATNVAGATSSYLSRRDPNDPFAKTRQDRAKDFLKTKSTGLNTWAQSQRGVGGAVARGAAGIGNKAIAAGEMLATGSTGKIVPVLAEQLKLEILAKAGTSESSSPVYYISGSSTSLTLGSTHSGKVKVTTEPEGSKLIGKLFFQLADADQNGMFVIGKAKEYSVGTQKHTTATGYLLAAKSDLTEVTAGKLASKDMDGTKDKFELIFELYSTAGYPAGSSMEFEVKVALQTGDKTLPPKDSKLFVRVEQK